MLQRIIAIRSITDPAEQDIQLDLFGRAQPGSTQIDSAEISPTQPYIPMGADVVTVESIVAGAKAPAPAAKKEISLASAVLNASSGSGMELGSPHSVLTAGAVRPPNAGSFTPRPTLSSGWAAPVTPHSAEAVRTHGLRLRHHR